jgi:hypothetical protein
MSHSVIIKPKERSGKSERFDETNNVTCVIAVQITGRALVPIPKRSTSPRATSVPVDSLKATNCRLEKRTSLI